MSQAKKKQHDTELENMEKTHKQTIEKMEADHNVKLKEETKRIKAEQERDYHKFLEQLKHKKKEVHWKLCDNPCFVLFVVSEYETTHRLHHCVPT